LHLRVFPDALQAEAVIPLSVRILRGDCHDKE
jgi:hypothetical protein